MANKYKSTHTGQEIDNSVTKVLNISSTASEIDTAVSIIESADSALSGQVLTADGSGGTSWQTPPAPSNIKVDQLSAENPSTSQPAAIGSVPMVDSNYDVVWGTPPQSGMINPMTAAGDIIVGGASGTPARLAKGTAGQALQIGISGDPEWKAIPAPSNIKVDQLSAEDPSTSQPAPIGSVPMVDSNYDVVWGTPPASGMTNPMTTAGDIIVGGTSGTPARLAKGTAGQVLKATANGVEWGDVSGGGGTQLYLHTITFASDMPDPDLDVTALYIITTTNTALETDIDIGDAIGSMIRGTITTPENIIPQMIISAEISTVYYLDNAGTFTAFEIELTWTITDTVTAL